MALNLRRQGLTEFPEISPLETSVALDYNNITTIPEDIIKCKELVTLQVRYNKVSILPKQIGTLSKLSVLMLTDNQITELPPGIGDLSQLTQLRLDTNNLTSIPREIGKLKNLTHLFLAYNKLSWLPGQIKDLSKLVYLSLEGNNIPLPPTYATNKPAETIAYILENQELVPTESLITKKAYYFTNTSKESVEINYLQRIKSFAVGKEVEFIRIFEHSDISAETNVLFIIAPIDAHENEHQIYSIIEKCKEYKIRFFILVQKGLFENSIDSINLSKGETFERLKADLKLKYPGESKDFNSYEDLESIFYEALKQHKPIVKLAHLHLENIGHYSILDVPFDKELTCIIGENGIGKSTILRAIAFAIIGDEHRRINDKARRNFLKIQGYFDDQIQYENGLIKLDYTIDGDNYTNELVFSSVDSGRDVSIRRVGDFALTYNQYNLKSLIVGFPQARGNDSFEVLSAQNKITIPHVSDLIPVINNEDDHRLQSFSSWIANLFFEFVKNKDASTGNRGKVIIDEVFRIISEITRRDIKFKTVKAVAPPEVWISTYESPQGIPLDLISQGFKIVIGWIGYFMQRFVDTFPLSDPISTFSENAILLLDEIDTSIHPMWQASILPILRKTFPNTQFIFTTHSPLVVAGLNREQVVELVIKNQEVIALKNQVDTWAFTYRDILEKLFDTTDPTPKVTKEELQAKLANADDETEIDQLKDNIQRLEESAEYKDNLVKYERELKAKQQELDQLIEKYKALNR